MTAYYNEIDPYCAQWLRNLVAAGLIPAGDVDERPIEEVAADDVRPYTQAHFFAGIGGWAYAARLAGWPDDRPIWTGSCPCQPFSNAGKRLAYDDPRNLWPDFARLIQDCRPPAVAGEQVASKAGRLWLAGVRADLEALGYGVGAADLCAAGIGAPHIRQRLWWVADHEGIGRTEGHSHASGRDERTRSEGAGFRSADNGGGGGLGHASSTGSGRDTRAVPRAQAQSRGERQAARREPDEPVAAGADGGLDHPQQQGLEGHAGDGDHGHEPGRQPEDAAGSTAEAGGDCGMGDAPASRREGRESPDRSSEGCQSRRTSWDDAIWIPCADGKARRIEPGIIPLVDGFPGRVDQVRAYGNSIVPQVAAEFLTAYIEAMETP